MIRPAVFLTALVLLLQSPDGFGASAEAGTGMPVPNVAVFVPENLSGRPASLAAFRESFVRAVTMSGISVLDDASLGKFMARHRIRYTGGLDADSASALKSEEKIDAVLISSVEFYDEGFPPKMAVSARLVSTGETPEILWMDSVAVSGDDSPGILGIGLITNAAVLREKVVGTLVRSLTKHLSGGEAETEPVKERYGPKLFYRSAGFFADKKYTVAVVPFLNVSDRKYGNEIMVLHFVAEIIRNGSLRVVEPGVLRQKLLNVRFVMGEGISLSDADIAALSVKADVVLTGKVMEYQDVSGPEGTPKVDFSAAVIERAEKKVIWASISYNQGNDGVFFFDVGRVNTAGRLATYMARAVVEKMSRYEEEGEAELSESPLTPVLTP